MSFKAYEEFKDSNIDWIGPIPNYWQSYKLKHVINEFIAGGTPKSSNDAFWDENNNGIPWIAIGDMTDNDYVNSTVKNITREGLADKNLRILKKGTLIYSIFASLGKTAILNIDATTNQAILGLITSTKIDVKYLKYYLEALKGTISRFSNENTQENLNSNIVKNMEIAMPESLEEQKQIANYLDKQTAKIDSTIAKNKELIQLLEEKRVTLINQVVTKGLNPDVSMKDSGVKWIGEIPEHWGVEKIKNLSKVKPSNVDKKTKDNEPSVLLCNYTDVYNNEFITMDLDFMKATATYDQIKKLSLNVGDIIITKDSESADDIAVPAIVTEKLENVVCGYHLAVIRPNEEKIYPKFLFRSFESDKINKQFEHGAHGVTRFGLGTYPIKNAYVCQPPLSEQKEIANYLDNENSKIYKAINKIMVHTDLLEEYKTSLIHNVVTGKIDVREEVI